MHRTGSSHIEEDAPGRHATQERLPWMLALVAAVSLAGAWLLRPAEGAAPLVNFPLHSTFEAIGGVASIALAVLLLVLQRARQGFEFYVPAASGLLVMGVFDTVHAALPPGDFFVWTRTMATVLGSLGFVLVWLPAEAQRRAAVLLPAAFLGTALVGAVAAGLMDSPPHALVASGTFTPTAVALNLASAALFGLATLRLAHLRDPVGVVDRMFLAAFCLFQSLTSLLFSTSRLWQLDWWWWHALRVVAAVVLLLYAFRLQVRQQVELHRAVGTRDEFLSVAAHELRTPLALLAMQNERLVRLLEHEAIVPEARARVASVNAINGRQVRRLGRLVDELLDITRLDRGQFVLRREAVDLGLLVEQVLELSEEELRRAGCTVEASLGSGVHGAWDPLRVEQVVGNLLTNARKFGAGRPIRVEVSAADGRARLSVRDQGIGIAPADQRRIFERFTQVAAKPGVGFGLGLYITDQIVRAHGGTLRVESTLGEGATFVVELPMGPDAAA